jgi:hypothetical protein
LKQASSIVCPDRTLRVTKQILLPLFGLLLICSCNPGYGPVQDHSEFVSAQLIPNRRALFSFHRFAYRAAAGWRAFPDGGIPAYVADENVLGIYDLDTRKVDLLRRERNSTWQPGSGLFAIHAVKGTKALIAQGGQLRGPFQLGIRHLLVDFKKSQISELDLKSDLARRGRDLGQIYLADSEGTLVFITLSLDEARDPSAYRDGALVPEIWVRTPIGDYLKAAASAHYEKTLNGEVIYWEPTKREFMAFSIASREVHELPRYKVSGYADVREGVILSSDRKCLQFGVKVGDQWHYEATGLTAEMLR